MSYLITDDGHVYGEKRKDFLAPWKNRCGYLCVLISIKGKVKHMTVHRLVAEAFIPNPDLKRTVNHKNGNKADNRVSNLEWATHSENNLHRFRVLGVAPSRTPIKLSTKKVRQIKDLLGKQSRKQIARRFSVAPSTIDKIAWGKKWRHV